VAGLGAVLTGIAHVPDEPAAVAEALLQATREGSADIVLTAGGASTDPGDAFFVALAGLGGRIVRHGVPAHPGSMLWLGRLGRAAVVGLPSCGAYSRATAADLLLPLLVAGYPASPATVARLAHGGVLDRAQRFRFPAYARDMDAPEG
jgi:molybdopterin biosynthesis enzyme